MKQILSRNEQQYFLLVRLLESFKSAWHHESKSIDIDNICSQLFDSEYKKQFKNQEFVIIYNFLDALADAKEHEFDYLFNNLEINYQAKEAIIDLELLINSLNDCIDNKRLLSKTALFLKIKTKTE